MNTSKIKQVFPIIINGLYILFVLLFLLDAFNILEIKSQVVKSTVYGIFLFGTPVILLCNLIFCKEKKNKLIGISASLLSLLVIIIVGPQKIMMNYTSWKTQIILYEHNHLRFKKIELQKKDIGALGYASRTVETTYLTPLFMITKEIATEPVSQPEWRRVDIDCNELNLKLINFLSSGPSAIYSNHCSVHKSGFITD